MASTEGVSGTDSATSRVGEGKEKQQLSEQIAELGPWFHNLDLHGVRTAPKHFLGDYPNVKWERISPSLPQDFSGLSVLDIGCNAGFYSIEAKRRGAARVCAVDTDERYLAQGRFASRTLNVEIDFRQCSVYDLNTIEGQFDLVFFMGIFYHLRYPLFALDKVVKRVRRRLVFQTMIRPASRVQPEVTVPDNIEFWKGEVLDEDSFPHMHFIEHRFASDPTNWWIPNASAAEAMLRSTGLVIVDHPEDEVWICEPHNVVRNGRYMQDAELKGEPW